MATLLALAREDFEPAPPEPLALLSIIEETVLRFAYLRADKPVRVEVDVAARVTVSGHRQALTILLSNLLGNAFSHTLRGAIRVSMEYGGLLVADSGPGIDAALRERLYEAGVKGGASTGFGLSISSRMGERFGMALSVENGAPSVFTWRAATLASITTAGTRAIAWLCVSRSACSRGRLVRGAG